MELPYKVEISRAGKNGYKGKVCLQGEFFFNLNLMCPLLAMANLCQQGPGAALADIWVFRDNCRLDLGSTSSGPFLALPDDVFAVFLFVITKSVMELENRMYSVFRSTEIEKEPGGHVVEVCGRVETNLPEFMTFQE